MMFSKKYKDINFYASFNKRTKEDNAKLKKLLIIVFPIMMICVFAIAFVIMGIKVSKLNEEINDIKLYTADPEIIKEYDNAKKIAQDTDALSMEIDELKSINKVLASYPVFDSEKINRINAALPYMTKINQMSYESVTGVVNMDLTAPDESYAPIFVKQLRATKIFGDMSYYGYSGGENGYSFRVVAILKGGNQ